MNFVCTDCHQVKAAIDGECQVIFGAETCPRCGLHEAPVGRCLACGQGLPVIDLEQPFRFRWNERLFQFSLSYSPSWHVWLYLVQQHRHGCWENVKVIRTYELRDAISKLRMDPITEDEVLDAARALQAMPDEDFAAAFRAVAASPPRRPSSW